MGISEKLFWKLEIFSQINMLAQLNHRFLSPPLGFSIDQLLRYQTSQRFGQNLVNYSQFKDAQGNPLKGHNGEDYPCADGQPILATHSGRVVRIQDNISQGYGIWILGEEMDFEGIKVCPRTSYWHLKSFSVSIYDEVIAGQTIGLADSTGFSTATHLHFGLKLLYPNLTDVFKGNGYDGYISPRTFYKDIWFPGQILGTYPLIEPMAKLVKLGSEQYLRTIDGVDYHLYNVTTLTGLFEAKIIPSLEPEEVASVNDSGKELVILIKE